IHSPFFLAASLRSRLFSMIDFISFSLETFRKLAVFIHASSINGPPSILGFLGASPDDCFGYEGCLSVGELSDSKLRGEGGMKLGSLILESFDDVLEDFESGC